MKKMLEDLKKELSNPNYGMWTNARRYSFENIIIMGLGLFLSLFADVLYVGFTTLVGGKTTHPMNLGMGQIIAVLLFTFLLIQNILRWRDS